MILIGQQRRAFAQLAMALRGLFTLIAAMSAAYAGLGPWAFILAFVGAPTLMSAALTAWILVKELGGVATRAGFVARRITRTIRDSAYFAICNLGNAVAFGTGTLVVAAVLGPGDAGLFSVANRMFTLVGSLAIGSGAQLWPAMTEAITRGDIGWARSRYRRGIVVVGLATSMVCLGLVVFGQPLARVWVGSALVPPFDLLVWTAALTVAVTVSTQACVLLRAVDRLRALAALSVASAVASVIASIQLTHLMGMSGAAVGALVACICLFLPGVAVLARRALKGLGDT
jgi:O-antigen/teichoic acid export membrane protein